MPLELDFGHATMEERHRLRRILDEVLADQIDGGATEISIDVGKPAYDETLRLIIRSNTEPRAFPVVVLRGGGTAA